MRLSLQQIDKLVPLVKQFRRRDLKDIVRNDMNIDLDQVAPAAVGDYEAQIRTLIAHLQGSGRGRGDEFIQTLENSTDKIALLNGLQAVKTHDYTAPSQDPHEAILLGQMAFYDRSTFRQRLPQISNPTLNSPRVMLVSGDSVPCGKSHSWHLIRHVAGTVSNAKPHRIRLDTLPSGDPVELMKAIKLRLGLSADGWPDLPDDPQDSQAAKQLAQWFMGKLGELAEPVWLVIDDLNGSAPTRETLELVELLAIFVQETYPDNLWLFLIGFDRAIMDDTAHFMLKDQVYPPTDEEIRLLFEALGKSYGQQLSATDLQTYVDTVLQPVNGPPYDHASLQALSRNIERLCAKVRQDGGFPT